MNLHNPSFSKRRSIVNRPALASRHRLQDEDEAPKRSEEDGDGHAQRATFPDRTEQSEFQVVVFQPGQMRFCWGYR